MYSIWQHILQTRTPGTFEEFSSMGLIKDGICKRAEFEILKEGIRDFYDWER